MAVFYGSDGINHVWRAATGRVPLPKLAEEKCLGGHAVVIVGEQDHYAIVNLYIRAGRNSAAAATTSGFDDDDKVWILRNSWGCVLEPPCLNQVTLTRNHTGSPHTIQPAGLAGATAGTSTSLMPTSRMNTLRRTPGLSRAFRSEGTAFRHYWASILLLGHTQDSELPRRTRMEVLLLEQTLDRPKIDIPGL